MLRVLAPRTAQNPVDEPSLTATDLEAAWDYVAANREEIERAIREDEEGDDGPVE